MNDKPYKVVPLEPGRARVDDRDTGKALGVVCQDNRRLWTGYIEDKPVTGEFYFRSTAAHSVWSQHRILTNQGVIS